MRDLNPANRDPGNFNRLASDKSYSASLTLKGQCGHLAIHYHFFRVKVSGVSGSRRSRVFRLLPVAPRALPFLGGSLPDLSRKPSSDVVSLLYGNNAHTVLF